MNEIIGESITLKFALKTDMRKIHEMMVSDEIGQFMFDEEHPAPSWQKFQKEKQMLFPEMASRSGSYLLIQYEGEIAGSISYVCGYDKKPYAEIDVWLAGYEYMGKQIGCDAIKLLRNYLHESYDINAYIIRPWTQNLSSIQAYNRCGFYTSSSFSLSDYYSDEDMRRYGAGAYGERETLNLYFDYSEQFAME